MGASAISATRPCKRSSDASSASCRSSHTMMTGRIAASCSRNWPSTARASSAPCSGRPARARESGLSGSSNPSKPPSSAATSAMRRSPNTFWISARNFNSGCSSEAAASVAIRPNRSRSRRATRVPPVDRMGAGAARTTRHPALEAASHSSSRRDLPKPSGPTTVTACGVLNRSARSDAPSSARHSASRPTNPTCVLSIAPYLRLPAPSRPETPRLHVYDDDPSIGLFFLVLFLLVFLVVVALPMLVVRRDLQPGALLTAALLLFAAADLFNDPGLEHGDVYL